MNVPCSGQKSFVQFIFMISIFSMIMIDLNYWILSFILEIQFEY